MEDTLLPGTLLSHGQQSVPKALRSFLQSCSWTVSLRLSCCRVLSTPMFSLCIHFWLTSRSYHLPTSPICTYSFLPWKPAKKQNKIQHTAPFQDTRDSIHRIFEDGGPMGCLWIHGGYYLLQSLRHLYLYFDTVPITSPFSTLTSLLIFLCKSNKLMDIIWPYLSLNLTVNDPWKALWATRTGHLESNKFAVNTLSPVILVTSKEGMYY